MERSYQKLVRDNIPQIPWSKGEGTDQSSNGGFRDRIFLEKVIEAKRE